MRFGNNLRLYGILFLIILIILLIFPHCPSSVVSYKCQILPSHLIPAGQISSSSCKVFQKIKQPEFMRGLALLEVIPDLFVNMFSFLCIHRVLQTWFYLHVAFEWEILLVLFIIGDLLDLTECWNHYEDIHDIHLSSRELIKQKVSVAANCTKELLCHLKETLAKGDILGYSIQFLCGMDI